MRIESYLLYRTSLETVLRALVGKRGAVPGEEKWVTEEEVAELLASATATGIFTKTTAQLRAMLARHRHWEATVRAAVVGALLCSGTICTGSQA